MVFSRQIAWCWGPNSQRPKILVFLDLTCSFKARRILSASIPSYPIHTHPNFRRPRRCPGWAASSPKFWAYPNFPSTASYSTSYNPHPVGRRRMIPIIWKCILTYCVLYVTMHVALIHTSISHHHARQANQGTSQLHGCPHSPQAAQLAVAVTG